MKTIVHIISHSHWDREWYLAFEQHRMKLVELIDSTMELFDKDPAFRSFHLDSQTIVLDDYLEIKPENEERLNQYIKDDKFVIGPWYILQDEFLTSGEANVRNLLMGMQEAERHGKVCKIGYFPDAFGNAGQMPQLLKQAGMKAIVFGRGVKPVGFNNMTMEGGEYESVYSEMKWEAPDGSVLPAILFANWYNNGVEIPVDEQEARTYWEEKLAQVRRFAGTRHLLLMNGCDHQPVQKNLVEAIETARKLYPDIEFIHSDFNTYVDAVIAELREDVSTVKGELTSQETDGLYTLVNTCSSRVDLKQMNRVCETALEKEAEPIAVLASLCGKTYPGELLRYSWKVLMQNHPHDSICNCSVDEVHDEMKIRFDKSRQVSKNLSGESVKYLAQQIDVADIVEKEQNGVRPFAVFNTTGWERTGVAEVIVDYERIYGSNLEQIYNKMMKEPLVALCLKDESGEEVDVVITDMGVNFGYDLPDDKFRQPYMARQIKLMFEAKNVPAFGYRTYYVAKAEKKLSVKDSLVTAENVMENAYVKVEIAQDGSYTLTEKSTGHKFEEIGFYEETADIGNEYLFVQGSDKMVISTKGLKADIELVEDEPFRAVYQIRHNLEVPACADDTLEEERRKFKNFYERQAGRCGKTVLLPITTLLTLERGAKGIKVETRIENTAKDHRIRVMIPARLETSTHVADSMFEVAERNNRHSSNWKNPSECEHQQNFVAIKDDRVGILVANFGLYEYEMLPDRDNTIAVTLLRAVGEMGDWGVFPTPKAQMQGTYTMRYEIVPFPATQVAKAYREAYQFQVAFLADCIEMYEGKLPMINSFFQWKGEGLNLTGFKKKENSDDVIVRFVNNAKETVKLIIKEQEWMKEVYNSNVIEEKCGILRINEEQCFTMDIKPYEIATVGIMVRE